MDENSVIRKEMAKKEREDFEQNQMKLIELGNKELSEREQVKSNELGEIPLSLEEMSKYGYGFDLDKYKLNPS